ncbi:MAG: MFS transporter [Desulfobulbaceae bacterium]|nr:MFS transporter [Desulfobulbaceae bacterium]
MPLIGGISALAGVLPDPGGGRQYPRVFFPELRVQLPGGLPGLRAAGGLTCFLALRLPVPEEPPQAGQAWGETWQLFKSVLNRGIVITCLVEAAILFAYGTFETFLPMSAVKNGLGAAQVGLLLSDQIMVLALTKPLIGRFSDRHGRGPQIFAGGVLGAACLGGFDWYALLAALVAFIGMSRFKWGMIPVIIGSALAGLAWKMLF